MNIFKFYAIKFGFMGVKKPITIIAFRDYCIDVFKSKLHNSSAIITGDDSIKLIYGNKDQVVFFGNAYKLYLQSKDEINNVVNKYISGYIETLTLDESFDSVSLLPVIKDKSYWGDVSRIGLKDKDGNQSVPVRFEINEILDVYIVADTEFNMRYVTTDQLAKYNVDLNSALSLALKNYDDKFGLPEIIGNDGEFMLRVDGNYEASMILSARLMKKIKGMVDGDLVFFVPARDLVLLTGSKNNDSIRKFKALSLDVINNSPYSLTDHLFMWDNGKISVYPTMA